ncbi:hypothetical protein [Stenotrophomonas sp. 364]|uniref:hypothetical protein n=1 Tax=Stenotrophomonas sp. 364 TaxID=2691571 RepID=UPI0013185D80|nr:hypothetical protein [Stenotrophomonas sp. 364]QHB72039.1 hypothetical protein GQ674_12370 [Stenotrophomonas sp. 364]
MSTLQKDLDKAWPTGVLKEDRSGLLDVWRAIKDLIDAYEGKEMPADVANAIAEAIRWLVAAISEARKREEMKRELEKTLEEIDDLEEKLRENLSIDERKRVEARIKDLREQAEEFDRQLGEQKKIIDDMVDGLRQQVGSIPRPDAGPDGPRKRFSPR